MRIIASMVGLVVLLTAMITAGPAYALADGPPAMSDASDGCYLKTIQELNGTVKQVLHCPGEPGKGGNDGGSGKPIVDKDPTCTHNGAEIPCTHGDAVWNGRCYARTLSQSEAPPKSAPVWQGHDDGVIVSCTLYSCIPGAGRDFIPNCPNSMEWRPGPVEQGPDPEVLAMQAIDQMRLRPIDVGITLADPGDVGAVGIPVWTWVDEPSPTTYGPNESSVTAGGTTVTATANVRSVEWNFGDGTVINCDEGTPYQEEFGFQEPDCGHTYEEQGDPYTVTAESHWEVTWEGGGFEGTIPVERETSVDIVVGEIQVLNQ